jgi:hypothetical protein
MPELCLLAIADGDGCGCTNENPISTNALLQFARDI